MTPATIDPTHLETDRSIRERAIDAVRQAGNVCHDARRLKLRAADAVEDGVHAATRAITSVQRRVEALDDLKDEAAYRVKRQPFAALGLAVGVGLVCGVVVAWLGGRLGNAKSTNSSSWR